MRIHIDHLSYFIVGGGHIFVSDIFILSESIESRIEISSFREKIASTGMIKIGSQALLYIFGLENLNDLFSFYDVPVGSVHAETVYCLITVVVCDVERPQYHIMVHAFLGRLNATGTAVHTMKNAGYPQYQAVELSVQLYKMIIVAAEHYIIFVY